VALLAILVVTAFAVTATISGAQRLQKQPRAHASHTLSGTETGRLHLIRASGSHLFEQGPASGPLPGYVKADLNIGATFTGGFAIYTRSGTIRGHGRATPHGSGRYESFGGSGAITGGSGRYAHAHAHVGFYGTFDRRTYAVVIQAVGTLHY
jgi:hypothetical protein